MKCPHCTVSFHPDIRQYNLEHDIEGEWFLLQRTCPECHRYVFHLKRIYPEKVPDATGEGVTYEKREEELQVWPKGGSRNPCPQELDHNEIKEDYEEACLVLPNSAKASAALSRRCLQNILREKAGVQSGNLFDEIQEVIDAGLPSHLAESIASVRNIGNFATHPIKSKNTGQVVPVEPGEAEWNLEVIEQLLDFYFVQPTRTAAKRAALNKKLKDAGKPEMQ